MNQSVSAPWNKDRAVGQKRPFSRKQIQTIARHLEDTKQFRNLCLLCFGVDTMLRGSDLVRLKMHDVMHRNRHPKTEFNWNQKKTGKPVISAITPYSQSAISCLAVSENLQSGDYLFKPKRSRENKHITTCSLRHIVKQWAEVVGLEASYYSGHSLRRSKPSHLYAQGVRPEMLRLLLGHKSLQSTQVYLGIDQRDALDLARKYDCFRET